MIVRFLQRGRDVGPGFQGRGPGRSQPEPGPAFDETAIDHRESAQDLLESVHQAHTAPLAVEAPVHRVAEWLSSPDRMKERVYPSRSPSSRERMIAWLRVEDPSFR